MRNVLAPLCLSVILCGCGGRSSAPSEFGDGDAILKGVFGSALSDYDLQFAEIEWSGGASSSEFARHDNLIVQDASIKIVADKLEAELGRLPKKRNWSSHGSGRTGDRFLRINFEENRAQFYMDFLLTQDADDVEIYVLYKGVKL